MAIALTIFGVTFAALSVWLTVRIINRRERWAKWTLGLTIALPVLYVASLWPVIRWGVNRQPATGTERVFVTHSGSRELPPSAPQVYWPIGWAANHGNHSLRSAIIWYATSNYDMVVYLPTDRNGRYELVMQGD